MESLCVAIEGGDAAEVTLLLHRHPDFDFSQPLNDGHPALYQAAKEGNVAVVAALLGHCGNSPEVLAAPSNDFDEISPLVIACLLNHLDVVEMLCDAGADVNLPDEQWGGTPLCLAAARGNLSMVKILCAAGADLEVMGPSQKTPLLAAVSAGNMETVSLLHAMGAKLNGPYPEGRALFSAIEEADTNMVSLVLDLGAQVNVRNTETGLTPLLTAARAGKTGAARLLLQRGADVTVRDYRGYGVLLSAIESNKAKMVHLVATHPDVDIALRSHHQLRNQSAPESAGHFRYDTQVLLNNAGRGKFLYSETALMVAARLGHLEALTALLDVLRAPDTDRERNLLHDPMRLLDERNDERSTALMLAVQHGHTEIVTELCARGANGNLYSLNGKFPLLVAIENGDAEMVKVLLEHEVNVNAASRNDRTTPLMLAVDLGKMGLLSTLSSKGAELDARDAAGHTALTRAIRLGNLDAVITLLELGAHPNPVRGATQTPLINAAMAGRADIVAALIAARADVDARSLGNTALMAAAAGDHVKVLRVLIAAGADIMATNEGRTAKQIAARAGAWAAYQVLLDAGDLTGDRKRRLELR